MSSNVSGNIVPNVSGRRSDRNPPQIAEDPIMTKGNHWYVTLGK